MLNFEFDADRALAIKVALNNHMPIPVPSDGWTWHSLVQLAAAAMSHLRGGYLTATPLPTDVSIEGETYVAGTTPPWSNHEVYAAIHQAEFLHELIMTGGYDDRCERVVKAVVSKEPDHVEVHPIKGFKFDEVFADKSTSGSATAVWKDGELMFRVEFQREGKTEARLMTAEEFRRWQS